MRKNSPGDVRPRGLMSQANLRRLNFPFRSTAFEAARTSFGWRRHLATASIERARVFEAWLRAASEGRDYAAWLVAKRALGLAADDSKYTRDGRRDPSLTTRSILRRAQVYRDFLESA